MHRFEKFSVFVIWWQKNQFKASGKAGTQSLLKRYQIGSQVDIVAQVHLPAYIVAGIFDSADATAGKYCNILTRHIKPHKTA